MRRLHDLLRDKYGKRMMMWGDIILNHPKNLADIPKDTIMLSWGYDSRASFESQITPFAQSGFEFFVCPGVSCWNRVMPDFQVSVTNIANFVRDGVKQNAMGMVNTTWDDSGSNLAGWNWYGVAWGAECAWNASATPIEAFNEPRRRRPVRRGRQANLAKRWSLLVRRAPSPRFQANGGQRILRARFQSVAGRLEGA